MQHRKVNYILQVPTKPNSREVSPAKFPYYMISAVKQVTNLHRMIAPYTTHKSIPFVTNSLKTAATTDVVNSA